MKKFEVGKAYMVNGGGIITVTKRTACFISYTGDRTGRSRVYAWGDNGIFGMGEHINVPIPNTRNCFTICAASHET